MIYFVSGNTAEQIKDYYSMERVGSGNTFAGNGALLTVTDKNDEAALTEINALLEIYPPDKSDMFVHIGAYNGENVSNGIFILNALAGKGRNGSFYPEMIYKHPFTETQGEANIYIKILNKFAHHHVFFLRVPVFGIIENISKVIMWINGIIYIESRLNHA